MPRSRRTLCIESAALRVLMEFGMFLDKCCSPRPLAPMLRLKIPATVSYHKGIIELLFYAPKEWRPNDNGCLKYPVLVNFHAGGFTIGKASDDSRWATTVVEVVGAVVVSVEYRLAPEYSFPTAVEDGVDALIYLFRHAEILNLDTNRLGLSGFSSGGNMAFTVWLRFQAELLRDAEYNCEVQHLSRVWDGKHNASLIVSWYPSVDFATCTRKERRSQNVRPDKEIPKFLTDLFDACYLHPPNAVSTFDPFLSPAIAPDSMLQSLPEDIIICTCEWDGLRIEAERFKERLVHKIGKKVRYTMVAGAVHAWDKKLRLVQGNPPRAQIYREVCLEIRRILNGW